MKQTKFSIALAIENPKNEAEILVVKRSPDDDSLPNIWGLPATSLKGSELPEEIVKRIGQEKLGTQVKPKSFIGIKSIDMGHYELILMDIRVKLIGNDPDVHKANTAGSKYVDQKWTSDFSILIPGAQQGSLCDRIFLESQNIDWEK